MAIGLRGLGFRVQGLVFRVSGLGIYSRSQKVGTSISSCP